MTAAEDWAMEAHRLVDSKGPDGIAHLLTDDFVQESYRNELRKSGNVFLETVQLMYDMGLHVSGKVVATAGDYCVLTHRVYHHPTRDVELLAISQWTPDGHLRRLVEFDAADLERALAMLGDIAGEPVDVVP